MGQIGLPLQCQNDSAGRGGDDDADSRDSSPERLVQKKFNIYFSNC